METLFFSLVCREILRKESNSGEVFWQKLVHTNRQGYVRLSPDRL
jgi:hypothetical protein